MAPASPQIDPALLASIEKVAELTAVAAEPWWIIGSAAMILHGAAGVQAADVDLLTARLDAERILGKARRPIAEGAGELFRSEIFGTLKVAPLPIDVMAGFHVRTAGGWTEVLPATRCALRVGASTVFVPEPSELIAITRSFARPKDLPRVRALERLIAARR